MFAQIMKAKTSDPEGVKRQDHRWHDELRKGAKGYVGSMFGVTADGTFCGFVLFDTKASAMANSNRPEQSAWWNETEKYFDGEVTFMETEDIDARLGGISPQSTFVQGMQGKILDRATLDAMSDSMDKMITEGRHDLLGMVSLNYGTNDYVAFSFFTSEAEAREMEAKPMPEEVQQNMQKMMAAMTVDTWLDFTDPWIVKA